MAVGRWYSRTCRPDLTPPKTEMLTSSVLLGPMTLGLDYCVLVNLGGLTMYWTLEAQGSVMV